MANLAEIARNAFCASKSGPIPDVIPPIPVSCWSISSTKITLTIGISRLPAGCFQRVCVETIAGSDQRWTPCTPPRMGWIGVAIGGIFGRVGRNSVVWGWCR